MAGALVGALSVLSLFGAAAHAADGVYWVDVERGHIFRADLAGGAPAEVPIPNAGKANIGGVVVDPAAGKLYWTEIAPEPRIMVANLDGSGAQPLNTAGAEVKFPIGLALDARGGRIYWANVETQEGSELPSTIAYANLDGSGGGMVDTTGASVGAPQGLAVYPAAGRIYWPDIEAGKFSFANLAGGGGGTLDIDFGAVSLPVGVAIDAAAQRIYWSDTDTPSRIAFASLAGGQATELMPSGIGNPLGVALDTAANRIYWGQRNPGGVMFANPLDGSGVGGLDRGGLDPEVGASLPILFKAPASDGKPTVSGARRTGSTLTCAAAWLPDAPEAQLYRAAQSISYRWMRGGNPISGATGSTLKVTEAASYSCQSVATNGAGSTTSARSAPLLVPGTLKLGRVKTNRAKGTATVAVTVNGAGLLIVSGKDVARTTKRVRKSGTYRLTIRPKGKAKRKLRAAARARVKLTVTFAPEGGKLVRRSKTIALRRR